MSHAEDKFWAVMYGCNGCGYSSAQWLGFCPRCRDESGLEPMGNAASAPPATLVAQVAQDGADSADHVATGIDEFDRVLGGGLVPGVVMLVAGEPGVGKSTLLLQVAAAVADASGSALIASGEESAGQIGARARRIGASDPGVHVTNAKTVSGIIEVADDLKPSVVVVDSIQTVSPSSADAAPGSPTAVRLGAAELLGWAKEASAPLILIGHVNKDGAIAGPKVLEHVVDVVTSLDGDHQRDLRVLRCRKNRYGPTNRVGLFRLTGGGMEEVGDASVEFMGGWHGDIAGSVAFPAVEGDRPVTVEVQALVSPTPGTSPRRSVRGIDSARLHQVLAVLQSHANLNFQHADVYVGVSGGMRLREPAADLPVALALASSLLHRPLGRIAAWGEVGLTGEVREVAHGDWRVEETARLGLSGHLAPGSGTRRIGAVLAAAGLS